MKKLPLIFSIIALAGVIAFAIADLTRGSKKPAAVETADASVLQGEIVYFDMDRVLQEYDLANDGVAFAPTTDVVPAEALEMVEAAKKAIIAGEKTVPTTTAECPAFTLGA